MFFCTSRSRQTSGALVTGVQTCALPISSGAGRVPPLGACILNQPRELTSRIRSQLPAVTAAYVSLASVSLRFLSSGDGSSPRRRTFPPMDASSPLGWRTGLWPPSASCSLSVGSRLLFFAFPLPLLSRIILLLICH